MTESKCEHCPWRAKYDQNPKSVLGRLWRWHTAWCPGWRSYLKSLTEEKKIEVAARYKSR